MSGLGELLNSDHFGAGLTAGLLTSCFSLIVVGPRVWFGRRTRMRAGHADPRSHRALQVPGGVGAGFAIATLAAIVWLGPAVAGARVSVSLWLGTFLLWLAGAAAGRLRDHRGLVGALLALPAGALLAASTTRTPAWTLVLLVLGPAICGSATADFDERYGGLGIAALVFSIALAGMYTTVPDTELAGIALGAAAPITLLAWPFTVVRFGRGGSYAATGLFLWIAVVNGVGRSGSTIGAAACLGILVLEPLGRALALGSAPESDRALALSPVALITAQLILAAYCARFAGFATLAVVAWMLIVPVFFVVINFVVLRYRTERPVP